MPKPKKQTKAPAAKAPKKSKSILVEMYPETIWGFDSEDMLHVQGELQGDKYENLGRITGYKRQATYKAPEGVPIALQTLTGNLLTFGSNYFRPYLWMNDNNDGPHEDCIRYDRKIFDSDEWRRGGLDQLPLLMGHTLVLRGKKRVSFFVFGLRSVGVGVANRTHVAHV